MNKEFIGKKRKAASNVELSDETQTSLFKVKNQQLKTRINPC